MGWPTIEDFADFFGHDVTKLATNQITLLLKIARNVIAVDLDEDEDWADTLDPVPPALSGIAMQVAQRIYTNPESLKTVATTAGNWSQIRAYNAIGISLTAEERATIRRALDLASVGSVRVGSIIGEVYEGFDEIGVTLESGS